MITGMAIDYETADRITLLNMQDALATMEKEVSDHLEKGVYMHPEDLQEAMAFLIPAFKRLVKYYGGTTL